MAASTRSGKITRFSLLLLEDGEVLLSDLAVDYRFVHDSMSASAPEHSSPIPHHDHFVARCANAVLRGRVKVGTRNLFFDSDDWRDPVLRIPFTSIGSAAPTRDDSRPRHSDDITFAKSVPGGSDDNHDNNAVVLLASSAVFQRHLGTDHPYINSPLKGRHFFTPLYTSALLLLAEVQALLHITATTSRRSRDDKLRALVRERESRVPFDITLLQHGVEENAVMDAPASAVYAMSRTPGRFRITPLNLYFMPVHGESAQAAERVATTRIRSIRRLHHGCRDAALEIAFQVDPDASRHPTLMIAFSSTSTRDRAVDILLDVTGDDVEMFSRREVEIALNRWRSGELSNFDYLMYLNLAAGRSFNDLSQYPVFPWVLKSYHSANLDLTDADVFRDLSVPVGALNPQRLASLTERYQEMASPKFFYGTHYSTPAYTINYLVRAAPAAMLRLQNGRFDTPDRLFYSVAEMWRGVLTNPGDVKELIPEFYTLDYSDGNSSGVLPSNSGAGEFLDNVLGLDLGTRQDGKRVDDVELPPWANGSSELFVRQHREALESDHVSRHLHAWIDLIFGIKSKSADAKNVFYTDAALPGAIEDTSGMSAEEVAQIETVYLEFGRTPVRLFGYPHPPRFGDADSQQLPDESSTTDVGDTSWPTSNLELDEEAPPARIERKDHVQFPANTEDVNDAERTVASPAASIWGAKSRRKNSVLSGASDHILVSYDPSCTAKNARDTKTVTSPYIMQIVDPSDAQSEDAEIVDICALQETADSTSGALCSVGNDVPILCTIWSNGYLKVHSETSTLRLKHIEDVCSLTYIPDGIVCYGLLTGGIGLYYVELGRAEEIEAAAHDAEVYALEYVEESNVLLSGSKDGTLRIWRFEHQTHNQATIRLFLELDAESPINDVSGSLADETRVAESHERQRRLHVAAATADGHLLAWELDMCGQEDDFPEPLWRSEHGNLSYNSNVNPQLERIKSVTWLYQGPNRKHALASVHSREACLRVWSLDQTKIASAEAFLSDGGAKCIAPSKDSRSILVGGVGGQISEFDSTGLCLGRIEIGVGVVKCVLLPKNEQYIYILAGKNQVLRVSR